MASLNVFVKLLLSSPFPLFLHWHLPLPFCLLFLFPCIFLNFLGYSRGKYLVLQPRFYRLPPVRQLVRHSVWSHIFSRSVFSVLVPFCLQCFLSHIDCFGCICFQFFPCYYFSAAAPGISVLQFLVGLLARKTAIPRAASFPLLSSLYHFSFQVAIP